MMKKIGIIISLLSILLIGCENSGDSENEEIRVPVQVQQVITGSVEQTLYYSGDVKAEVEVKLFSKTPDRIEAFYYDEGDRVKKGEAIGRIASSSVEQGLKQAEAALNASLAQLANTKAEYERAQRLYKEDAMSQQQYDMIKTQYEAATAQTVQAKAALESARSMNAEASLTSPINGIIGKRYYDAGDMANMTVPVVTVVQMERVKVVFDAAEQDLGKLKIGQTATVQVKSYPDRNFTGKVTKISPILDPVTRMATIEVLVDNPDYLLKPGMFAEVVITIGIMKDVIVVPRYAVIESTSLKRIEGEDRVYKDYYVYIVNDSLRAENRPLEIDYINHKVIAVSSGVTPGEMLVVSGQLNLRENLPVMIAEEEAD